MWEIIQSGGPLMVPLILCALLSLGLSIERFLIYNSLPGRDQSEDELEQVETALRSQGQSGAVDICESGKGVLNYVFASLLKRYKY